ncbi:FdhF/YdeP family oxidoreductase [Candidatus Thalassarchaeum betae]|uniref:FdhF/YdeP family oxidoreductase n=1 Tax=Candidatus Thalassarchaeum betae TaxID=2599289 RepID=UPI0030C75677|nr:FdhF/YdeP family oxidoreductase [Candidatus Thalassoarchaea betae]
MGRDVAATTPSESSPPSLSKPKDVAAGIPAVISSLSHGITRMGTLASLRNFTSVNRFDGFDCPGCAWPDPDGHRTIAEFCENGAKAVADEGTRKRAGPEFWSQWSVGELSRKSDQWLNSQGRLTHPMILRPGSDYYSELSWDEAFDIIADELVSLDNPDQAVFYTSGRTSNEAAFLWQLLARRFGTNNLPDCSNMCHESSGVALSDSIGIGKGTVTLDDFTKADLIIVVGQNPGTNHPRMLTALRDAKRAGASIISINPLLETGMKRFKHPQAPLELLGSGTLISDEHVPVRVNGDFALFRGLAKVVMQREALDMEFIDAHTLGFADYRRAVESTSWDSIVSGSGVEQEVISNLGATISKSKSTIVCWAMGLTQHRNSVAIIQEIANLLLLGGHIGRPGAGVCPVRGHSNVQGDRTVGINHNPSAKFLSDLHDSTGIAIPTKPGVDSVRAVKSMRGGTAKVFLSMGGNFVSAMSDTKATASALSNCSITAQVSTKPNRSHLVTGRTALILPCLGRSEKDHTSVGEQFVSVENSMGIVHSSRGSSKPASGMLRSEPSIVSGIAGALDTRIGRSGIAWQDLAEDYDKVRDMIEASIPGFEGYNERVRLDGGFYLPNPPRDSRTFPTESGYANFRVHDLSGASAGTGRYLMMTIRSHDQYNTTIYGLDDRYRGINKGRRVVLMNQSDMDDNDWSEGDLVDLTSHFEGTELHAREWYIVPYEIPKGNIATYFPEANVLVPLDSVAEGSNTPTSKSVVVTIRATD